MNTAAPVDDYRTPWATVILLGSLTAFAAISIDMYLPSLPAISAGYHVAPGASQATLATFFAGLAIGQFFHGPASDRWGRRIPLFAGVALYVAASAWCALAPSLPMLCLARFFQALGGCAGPVIARAIVRDRFEHRQSARILSQLMLVMGVAPILAPLAGAGMLAFGGWPTIFWFLAGFGTVVGVWMFFALGESRSHETARQARGENPLAAYWALLRQRRLVGYMLAGALNSAALFAYLAASPSLLIGDLPHSRQPVRPGVRRQRHGADRHEPGQRPPAAQSFAGVDPDALSHRVDPLRRNPRPGCLHGLGRHVGRARFRCSSCWPRSAWSARTPRRPVSTSIRHGQGRYRR